MKSGGGPKYEGVVCLQTQHPMKVWYAFIGTPTRWYRREDIHTTVWELWCGQDQN